MTSKARIIAVAILGALLALTSCRKLALDPVFYALENEQVLAEDRGFPDEVAVQRLVKSGGLGGRYFAAANRLYTRLDGDSDHWTRVAFPASLSDAMCNALEVFDGGSGDMLYAAFFDISSGDGLGLYRSAPDPISWTNIADFGGVAGSQVTLLKAAGSELFAVIATWDSDTGHFKYSLSHSPSGNNADWSVIAEAGWGATPPNADLSIRDVASDGNYYWVIVGNGLYADDSGAGVGTFAKLSPPGSGTYSYGGLLYDSGTSTLYLSAGNGLLLSSTDSGASWTPSVTIEDSGGDPIPFEGFALPLADIPDGRTPYVGTRGFGYYRIPGGDVTPPGTPEEVQDFWDGERSPAYNIPALYNGAMNYLFFDDDPSPNRLFLCTAGDGLWRGEYVSGSDWSWKQE